MTSVEPAMTFVGTIGSAGGVYYAEPDDRRLGDWVTIPKKELLGARVGQKALVEVIGRVDAGRRGAGWDGTERRYAGHNDTRRGYVERDGADRRYAGRNDTGHRYAGRNGTGRSYVERDGTERRYAGWDGTERRGAGRNDTGHRYAGRYGTGRSYVERDGAESLHACSGKVIQVIGYANEPGVDVMSIILSHGFSTTFPEAATREAERMPESLGAASVRALLTRRQEGQPARRDLRGLRLFTIDGADARDLDDAVSIERCGEPGKPDGSGGFDVSGGQGPPFFRLGVHIADVSHYVNPGTALDREAKERGTSVYLADRVLPMLPQRLSNGICSLHPNADRLAVSIFMDISDDGEAMAFDACKSVVRSKARLTYGAVLQLLEGGRSGEPEGEPNEEPYGEPSGEPEGEPNEEPEGEPSGEPNGEPYGEPRGEPEGGSVPDPAIANDLRMMNRLALALRKRRIRAGAIEFSLSELKARVDEKGRAVGIDVEQDNAATQIIEEFMIACNETVATWMERVDAPIPYRTHDRPDPERAASFIEFAASLGFRVTAGRGGSIGQKPLQAVTGQARGTQFERAINTMMLRSMAKAAYTPENIGHFGLASKHYCHFTAPIRRYPDLATHRAVTAALCAAGMGGVAGGIGDRGATAAAAGFERGTARKGVSERRAQALRRTCAHCSERERAADSAEREVRDTKVAEYMRRFERHIFDGVVSNVTKHGMYVELGNMVEGRVSLSSLCDDYYVFDERRLRLVGIRNGKSYRIGDSVRVRLERSDPASRQIDFVLASQPRAKARAQRWG